MNAAPRWISCAAGTFIDPITGSSWRKGLWRILGRLRHGIPRKWRSFWLWASCHFGLKDRENGKLHRKSTCIASDSPGVIRQLQNSLCRQDHVHQRKQLLWISMPTSRKIPGAVLPEAASRSTRRPTGCTMSFFPCRGAARGSRGRGQSRNSGFSTRTRGSWRHHLRARRSCLGWLKRKKIWSFWTKSPIRRLKH